VLCRDRPDQPVHDAGQVFQAVDAGLES
jgi:hypothetical protein